MRCSFDISFGILWRYIEKHDFFIWNMELQRGILSSMIIWLFLLVTFSHYPPSLKYKIKFLNSHCCFDKHNIYIILTIKNVKTFNFVKHDLYIIIINKSLISLDNQP